MAAIGVFTNTYKAKYATAGDVGLTDATSLKLDYFKIGEKGHDGGSPPSPVTPSPTRTDVEAQYDQASSPPAAHDSYFKKDLAAGDVTATAGVLEIICNVISSEGNDDGQGNDPSYYEVGVFDEEDDMIVYCTFDEIVKDNERSIQQTITLTMGG